MSVNEPKIWILTNGQLVEGVLETTVSTNHPSKLKGNNVYCSHDNSSFKIYTWRTLGVDAFESYDEAVLMMSLNWV